MNSNLKERLSQVGDVMVDQKAANIIVPAEEQSTGFWFGGGNMVEEKRTGALYVVGRYRNYGDSRTGLGTGARGLQLAIFKSVDKGTTWNKVTSWSKKDLSIEGREVLSIEGSALHFTESGVELFVSTENELSYPDGIRDYQKPGTGCWGIKHLVAEDIDSLKSAEVCLLLETGIPSYLHIKDPFLFEKGNGDLVMLFCYHPFNWSSSNTGYAVRKSGFTDFEKPVFEFFNRGPCWDVGISRGSAVVRLPSVGILENKSISLFFYDGGECMRNLSNHEKAVTRHRGYSCEELGGLGFIENEDFDAIDRISVMDAAFVSPWGTGCSRYVDVLETEDGYHVTWQQCQEDLSQPLVHNYVSKESILKLLK